MLLVKKCSCSAKIVSSPVLVRFSSPSTPTRSPRSKHSASAQLVLAHLAAADEQLNLAGPVADVDEDQLPFFALQHDPSGGSYFGAMLGRIAPFLGSRLDGDLSLAGADVGDRHLIVESLPPRVETQLLNSCAASPGATPRAFPVIH